MREAANDHFAASGCDRTTELLPDEASLTVTQHGLLQTGAPADEPRLRFENFERRRPCGGFGLGTRRVA